MFAIVCIILFILWITNLLWKGLLCSLIPFFSKFFTFLECARALRDIDILQVHESDILIECFQGIIFWGGEGGVKFRLWEGL
jgi:hypothetical protein